MSGNFGNGTGMPKVVASSNWQNSTNRKTEHEAIVNKVLNDPKKILYLLQQTSNKEIVDYAKKKIENQNNISDEEKELLILIENHPAKTGLYKPEYETKVERLIKKPEIYLFLKNAKNSKVFDYTEMYIKQYPNLLDLDEERKKAILDNIERNRSKLNSPDPVKE